MRKRINIMEMACLIEYSPTTDTQCDDIDIVNK